MSTMQIANMEGLEYLQNIEKNSIDLVLTDPPYLTSRDTGMDKWVDHVAARKAANTNYKTESEFDALKTAQEWDVWMTKGGHDTPKKRTLALREAKRNFLKYGSIYGTKYAVRTNYGEWDPHLATDRDDQAPEAARTKAKNIQEKFVQEFYRTLRKGGTCIMFYDVWKLEALKWQMERAGFKQLRLIEWVKTNPQPLNSSRNYLTNCREFAVLGVKGSKPTFNSKYDNGIYSFPLQGGKYRIIPTQKSTALCEALIEKHSNPGDLVLDTFMGSGTTAVAAYNTGRNVKGCEMREAMYDQMIARIEGELKE